VSKRNPDGATLSDEHKSTVSTVCARETKLQLDPNPSQKGSFNGLHQLQLIAR